MTLGKYLEFFLKILENVSRISPNFGKLENDLYGHSWRPLSYRKQQAVIFLYPYRKYVFNAKFVKEFKSRDPT